MKKGGRSVLFINNHSDSDYIVMKKSLNNSCKCKSQLSSNDPEIVSILLKAAESSRLRTDKFMEDHYPETHIEDNFWKTYFHKYT